MPDSKFVQIRQVWHWFLEQQVSFTLAAVVSVFQYFRIEFGVLKDAAIFTRYTKTVVLSCFQRWRRASGWNWLSGAVEG